MMTRERVTRVAASLALGLGTLLLAATAAVAAPKGVGPSSGTTGTARACEVHAANNGKSVARGLNCAPTPPPPAAATFVVVVGPGSIPNTCDFTFDGTGLAPGLNITDSTVGGPAAVLDVVPANGTYHVVYSVFHDGTLFIFTAPTAAGGTIVVSAASVC